MKYNLMIFASHNSGKVEQVKQILRINEINLKVISAADVGFFEEVEENGKTFEGNAEIKAKALYAFCLEKGIKDAIIFADDAGLCVDKLNGEPGVYSARYAGESATEEEKRKLILEKMKEYKSKEERKAKFKTTIVAIMPNGEKIVANGECIGSIATEEGKTPNRLTYNQLFIPEGFEKTISEMNDEEFKKVHNHRERALLELIKKLSDK